MPGPGAKGVGDVAIRNYEAWQKVRINLNTIAENKEPDTGFDFFGKRMKYPIFAGPVGAVNLHYGDKLDDIRYNDILVRACREAGIAAFTGDGTNAEVMKAATAAIRAAGGAGIPTVKPWDVDTLKGSPDRLRSPWMSMRPGFHFCRDFSRRPGARRWRNWGRLSGWQGSRSSSRA